MKELFKHVSLFAGIGGFNLAADVMGWETVCSVENSEFCQTVLNYYWKNSKIYGDITRSKFHEFNGTIDIVSAGFPCQPFSDSGKRKGTDDHRNLWPETNRAISEIKPPFFVGENVSGLLSWDGGTVADTIKHDLEDQGYSTFFILFPALAIGANNIRERLWIVAYSESILRQRDYSKYRSCDKKEQAKKRFSQGGEWQFERPDVMDLRSNSFLQFTKSTGQPAIYSVDDALPFEVHGISFPKWRGETERAYGNAVNPMATLEIFKIIERFIYELSRSKKY